MASLRPYSSVHWVTHHFLHFSGGAPLKPLQIVAHAPEEGFIAMLSYCSVDKAVPEHGDIAAVVAPFRSGPPHKVWMTEDQERRVKFTWEKGQAVIVVIVKAVDLEKKIMSVKPWTTFTYLC